MATMDEQRTLARRLFDTAVSSTLCSAVLVQFTVPQIVHLSAATQTPLPRLALRDGAAVMRRALFTQSAITTVQFCLVRELRVALDALTGKRRMNMSFAYGAVSVPIVAAKYNLLTADTYFLLGGSRGAAAAAAFDPVAFWRSKIKPGLAWSFLRDSGSIGGSIALGPLLSAAVTRRLVGEGEAPSVAMRFSCGLATGFCTGLATQLLHNAALTAGRISELEGRCPGTLESMRAVFAEHGLARACFVNFQHRFAVIAGWSAILNVYQPFET